MTGPATRPARLAAALLLAAGLAACTPLYRNHGFTPFPEDLAQIRVGVDTRDSVAEAVGTPTAEGVTTQGGYYYVESRFRHFAFLAPEEISREVLAITFTPDDRVRNIARYGLEDGRVVVLQTRITEDNIPDRTFIQQLLRNISNFDAGTFLGDG